MKRKLLYITLASLISIFGFWSGLFIGESISKINNTSQKAQVIEAVNNQPVEAIVENETTLLFVGDMMLTRGVGTSVKNNFDGDFNRLFDNLSLLKDADILFGNLEGPVSLVGNNVGSKYSFRMDPSALLAIENAGFDIVSFANNHVGDWNVSAFEDTLTRLENSSIEMTGAGTNKEDAETPTIIEKNGVKFGFLGFSDVGPAWMEAKESKAGILLANDPRLPEIIQNAKSESDVLIISIHWGDEYKTVHNTRQEALAHKIIDNGADIIVGHHPHVAQDIETYNGKPIIYSLGNFIFDQYFSKNTMQGMMYKITFKGKEIISTEDRIVTLNKKYQPEGIFTEEDLSEKEKEEKKIESNVCPSPDKDYDDMSLFPIGQTTILPDTDYTPKNLEEIDILYSTKREICLIKEARDSFENLAKQAQKDGYTIKVSSGFRNYNTQKAILNSEIKSGNENANIAVAKAGHSEHQLGTAVDVTGQSIKYDSASDKFEKSDEAKWMEAHAYEYGFIESYPLGKEDITGYMYEPWHYRYVGIDNAKEIIKSGETINEYLERIK